MLEQKIEQNKSFLEKIKTKIKNNMEIYLTIAVLSLGSVVSCEKGMEKCYLPSTSEKNLCYFHQPGYSGYKCSSQDECKCLKPADASDEECECNCHTPSCCEKLSCSEKCVNDGFGNCKCTSNDKW